MRSREKLSTMVACKPLTTFVQTDTNAFREVVQRLTGLSEIDTAPAAAAATKVAGIKRTAPKLHERRHYTRPKLKIVKPPVNFRPNMSPTNTGSPCLIPSSVGTPSTLFSKLSLLEQDKRTEATFGELNNEEEEKAIKEKRFYLHPSPRSKPRYNEPELLNLFPLTSPETSEEP